MARKSKKRAKKEGKKPVPPAGSTPEAESSNQAEEAPDADSASSVSSSSNGNASEAEATATPDSTAQKSEESGVATFVKGTKQELDKVVWPSRQQLISESAAVILMVSLSATLIYLVDSLFSWGSRQVF